MRTPAPLVWAIWGVLAAALASEWEGRITGLTRSGTDFELTWDSEPGRAYQVQGTTTPGSRYWLDQGPPVRATGTRSSLRVPGGMTRRFFRVLPLPGPAFWYDWEYRLSDPTLTEWGLGTTQDGYASVDRPYEWYIDQADTGPHASANCGPAVATMALRWRDGAFSATAADARATLQRAGGWWYPADVGDYLALFGCRYDTCFYDSPLQLKERLSQGHLILLSVNANVLGRETDPARRTGRFYESVEGHFLVVKGWRAVDGRLFFEVYDPNNWHATYGDGTPCGRNRHYEAAQLDRAIHRGWGYFLLVYANGSPLEEQ